MRSKTRTNKTTGVIASAMQAVVEAITPKPIRAGDKLIIPPADPSMPAVIVPVRKRPRRKAASSTRRTTKARKGSKTAHAGKSTRPSARKAKRATKTARR